MIKKHVFLYFFHLSAVKKKNTLLKTSTLKSLSKIKLGNLSIKESMIPNSPIKLINVMPIVSRSLLYMKLTTSFR